MEQYTFRQIRKKFNWTTKLTSNTIEKQIQFAKNRGCIIELVNNKKPHLFNIISEPPKDEEWFIYPNNPRYEITKTGLVRVIKTKKLVGSKNSYGYIVVTDSTQKPIQYYMVHRMVMETFNLIDNAQNYVVDHINGIKDDNNISNLRWVLQRQNLSFRDENWSAISEKAQKIIEIKGYDYLNELLKQEIIKIQQRK